ncbi:PRC-barrel domain containing protein [Niveispirillum fermenti]|uniref:PRC-barrel domain containing protein n=1 Tax=Niveispirillum fermenti TaxID=1233113 RepID=UPI003A838EF5
MEPDTIAGWVAPAATMIAAMMTASNLGARVTGWGFVVFTLGSISWSVVGWATDQSGLLATNLFLTGVNMVGIWRWLGRQRAYEDGGRAAALASRRSAAPTLFTATAFSGMPVRDNGGSTLGKSVEALVECASGEISYVVVASGGVGGVDECLRAVAREQVRFDADGLCLLMPRAAFERIEPLADGDWPAEVGPACMAEQAETDHARTR